MNIHYSIPLNALCDSEGYPLQSIPELAYGDAPALVFTALDSENAVVDLSSASKWKLTVDVDHTVSTPHLCEVQPSEFTYNAATNTLSFCLNSKTLEFLSAVDGKSQVVLIAELCGYDADDIRVFRFSWNMLGLMPLEEDPDLTGGVLQLAVAQTDGDESTKTVSIRPVTVWADGSSVYSGSAQTVLYDFNIPAEEA